MPWWRTSSWMAVEGTNLEASLLGEGIEMSRPKDRPPTLRTPRRVGYPGQVSCGPWAFHPLLSGSRP